MSAANPLHEHHEYVESNSLSDLPTTPQSSVSPLLPSTYYLLPNDSDFQSAVVIATKLLHHAAEAYQQIGGTEQLAVPEQKSSYQKEAFFATLPEEFETKDYVHEAKSLGISERTAKYWLNQWIENGALYRFTHGQYQKCA